MERNRTAATATKIEQATTKVVNGHPIRLDKREGPSRQSRLTAPLPGIGLLQKRERWGFPHFHVRLTHFL